MRKLLFFIVVQFLFLACTLVKPTTKRNNNCRVQYDVITKKEVYSFVDEMPMYIGGNIAILKYFSENFRYPEQDQFQTTFHLIFVIDVDGSIIGVRIKDKLQSELTKAENEAIRVLKSMPKWIPGKCEGRKVPVLMFIPLTL